MCVCVYTPVNICARACTIETICSQWASMSHRSDLSHGIWGIHSPHRTNPSMHLSFFPFTFYLPLSPLCSFWITEFGFNHCISLQLFVSRQPSDQFSLSFIRFPWLFHLSPKEKTDNSESARITHWFTLAIEFPSRCQRGSKAQASSDSFYQLLYVTEYANQSGINHVFLQFVTCTRIPETPRGMSATGLK